MAQWLSGGLSWLGSPGRLLARPVIVPSACPPSAGCRRVSKWKSSYPQQNPYLPPTAFPDLCPCRFLPARARPGELCLPQGDAQLKSLLLYLCGSLLPLEGQAHSLCTSLNGTTRVLRMCLWNQRPTVCVHMDSQYGHVAHSQCLGLRSAGSQRKGACLLLTRLSSLSCWQLPFSPPGIHCAHNTLVPGQLGLPTHPSSVPAAFRKVPV